MTDFTKVSPLRVLERSCRKGLGRGNLGALVARAGVGKTACLIHIALDKLFRKERLVHVSLEDVPEKITSYYSVIYSDLMKALRLQGEHELKLLMDRNRLILAYLNQSFEIRRLRENLKNLVERIDFAPDSLIVDGLDFSRTGREVIQGFKDLAAEFQVEIWFSALSPSKEKESAGPAVPFPRNDVEDLFSIIIQLLPTQAGVHLKLLKDHEAPATEDVGVKLDPNTFLVIE